MPRKKKYQWGFDLTYFNSPTTFKKILKKFKLKKYLREQPYGKKYGTYYQYTWSNPNLKIITGNNPLTGIYAQPKQRQKEKGYASYIGIEGSKKDVLKLKNEIRKRAKYIKDESPRRREFI